MLQNHGFVSQGKEMLALNVARIILENSLEPFKWTPSHMFFPTSTVNYSWTVLAHFVTKAEKAKNMLESSL